MEEDTKPGARLPSGKNGGAAASNQAGGNSVGFEKFDQPPQCLSLNFYHFRFAFNPTITSPYSSIYLDREFLLRCQAARNSSLLSRPAASSVFHLRAKYLARRWWPKDEKRQGWHGGVGKERAGLRAFPGVRTKGATLGRLGGTHVERKRVVELRQSSEESKREELEIDFAVARWCFLISAHERVAYSFCHRGRCFRRKERPRWQTERFDNGRIECSVIRTRLE